MRALNYVLIILLLLAATVSSVVATDEPVEAETTSQSGGTVQDDADGDDGVTPTPRDLSSVNPINPTLPTGDNPVPQPEVAPTGESSTFPSAIVVAGLVVIGFGTWRYSRRK